MLSHPLINFEIQKHQNYSKYNGVYARNNLPKIKDEAYIINLDGCKLIGTDWIALYMNGDNFRVNGDSFRVEYIAKEI